MKSWLILLVICIFINNIRCSSPSPSTEVECPDDLTCESELCKALPGKPKKLTFKYVGGGEEDSDFTMDEKKVIIKGNAQNRSPVRVRVVDKDTPFHNKAKIFFDKPISLDDTFMVNADNSNNDKLPSEITVFFLDTDGNVLQSITLHTSCSQPLKILDRFASIILISVIDDENCQSPESCIPGPSDDDDDDRDFCPKDPNKTKPGICGCGVPDTDSDNDGVADCEDECPTNPRKTKKDDCGCEKDYSDGYNVTKAEQDNCARFSADHAFWIPRISTKLVFKHPEDVAENPMLLEYSDTKTATLKGVVFDGVIEFDVDVNLYGVTTVPTAGNPLKELKDACYEGSKSPCKISEWRYYKHLNGTLTATTGSSYEGAVISIETRNHAPQLGVCANGKNKKLGLSAWFKWTVVSQPNDQELQLSDLDDQNDININLISKCDKRGDLCPDDDDKTEPGLCGCGVPDVDTDNDGTPDCDDMCKEDPNKTEPGECGCGTEDTDTDNDGTADCNDGCPNDPDKVEPKECGCGTPETDTDKDRVPDCIDGCPEDSRKTDPGICGCGTSDKDTDKDGVVDCKDGCPKDKRKTEPGVCGCGKTDNDRDRDGTPDCMDQCPKDPNKIHPGVCGCGRLETDTDNDGKPDCKDHCPRDPNKITPGKCGCGKPETEACGDNCPDDPKKDDPGVCGCGIPDSDTDMDGVPDCIDGCPMDKKKVKPGICGCGTAETDRDKDGTPDCIDECPRDPHKITNGVCGCNKPDTDTDNDGTPDCKDKCKKDSNKTEPGVCGCGKPEVDTDNDGTPDCKDKCPDDPNKIHPGKCGCNKKDTDTDNDGVPDCRDKCPNDPNKVKPGKCGCGKSDKDSDHDKVPDCMDKCPNDPKKKNPGVCGCGKTDVDTDKDRVPDCKDECPDDPKKSKKGICGCGEKDTDTDKDGVPDCEDSCPRDPHKTTPGVCGCGEKDTDSDNDGTPDCLDGCPDDHDKIDPGKCGCGTPETDSDNDGKPDCIDNCPNDSMKYNPGECGCGVKDIDSDNDGVPDCNDDCPHDPKKVHPGKCGCGNPENNPCQDGCPTDPHKEHPGVCGCGVKDVDTDNDGTLDCLDDCPNDPNKIKKGICGCGVLDTDTDNDGVPDCNDGCPNDPEKTSPGICGCGKHDLDRDGDGTPDCNDPCPNDPKKVDPGICGCRVPDTDSDRDGTPDCMDECPNDPKKKHPGICGCGVSYVDTDGDKVPDCIDGCPNDPSKVKPGKCGCGTSDMDGDKDGIPDCIDGCPDDPQKTEPGVCGCGKNDKDTDKDGTADCNDMCPNDPNKIHPGVCGCSVKDTDRDRDGTPDCKDKCPDDPSKQVPGVCGCGVPETDTDNDGTPDCEDKCPNDPYKIEPGTCGCGTSDVDSDNDGTADCNDKCPNDPNKITPGICGCGVDDKDSDYNGIPDCVDECPDYSQKIEPGICGCGVSDLDSDHDGIPDCKDDCDDTKDSDNDGVNDCKDGCPHDPHKTMPKKCGCGTPDTDSDNDGIPDCKDNCPNDPHKNVPGICGCGVKDTDTDNDGVPDCKDNCAEDPDKIEPGVCGCGVSDQDSDHDTVPDCNDMCPNDPYKIHPGECGCGNTDTDSDNDGTPDCNDKCPYNPTKIHPGKCGCEKPDTDSDNDGTPDCDDMCPYDPHKINPGKCGCGKKDTDTDSDGTPDCEDLCPRDPRKVAPGVCGCGESDKDSDNDGKPDCIDKCPSDPNKYKPGRCGCKHKETRECCACSGVKSLTFKYVDYYDHPHVRVVISESSHASPSTFNYLSDGDFFTVFGTYPVPHYPEDEILGPNTIKVQLFDKDAPQNSEPFHTEHVDVTCKKLPTHGTKISYYLAVEKSVLSKKGKGCDDPCDFTLAVGIDIGDAYNNKTQDDLETIKQSLKNKIVQKLAGQNVYISFYTFEHDALQLVPYTNLGTLDNVQDVQSKIDTISFVGHVGTKWEPVLSLIHSDRPTNSEPNLVLLIVNQHPSDSITISALAANTLKNNGETTIIAIDTNDIDVTKLQAISGPLIGNDYYVSQSIENLPGAITDSCTHLCCNSDKDLCGICFGDSSFCADCSGTPNGNLEYDKCGICGGNNEECDPVKCTQDAHVDVKEKTSLKINTHPNTGEFEFKFSTCYQPKTAVVVGFNKYKNCSLRERGTCDNRLSSTYDKYCDLFTVEYPDESVWNRKVNETSLSVDYNSKFTLHDLLKCKDFDGNGQLLDSVVHSKHYKGTLFGTVVKPNDCYDESKCETITIGTHYDFELWVSSKGKLSSTIITKPSDFHGKWNRNIWLNSGDIIVEFYTYVESNHEGTYLCNPHIIRGEETGIPFHLITNGSNPCTGDNISPDTVCKQVWQIRTFDAYGVLDFSGIKPIQFDVCIHETPKFKVLLSLSLKIVRSKDPVTASLTADAWLAFYRDPERQKLISTSNDTLINCNHIFARVKLHNTTLPIYIDKVVICTGKNGDPTPFDPSYPDSTGCNTPNIDVIVYTLYDKKENFTNELFKFEFDRESSDVTESLWKFEAKAISQGKQIIEVDWSSHASNDIYYHKTVGKKRSLHLRDIKNTGTNYYASVPKIPHSKLINGRASLINKQYNQEYYLTPDEKIINGLNEPDRLEYGIENPTITATTYKPGCYGNSCHYAGKSFSVKCPDYQQFLNGDCVDRVWGNLYYNVYILCLVIAIPTLIFVVWACLKCGYTEGSLHHHNECNTSLQHECHDGGDGVPVIGGNTTTLTHHKTHHHHHHNNGTSNSSMQSVLHRQTKTNVYY